MKDASTNSRAFGVGNMLKMDVLTAPSRIYVVEFFVVLLTIGLMLISGISLFNQIVDVLVDKSAPGTVVLIGGQVMVLSLAVALFAVPAFLLFYTRTRKAERTYKALIESRARRRLIYIFLMIASVFLIGYVVGLIYTFALAFIGALGTDADSWYITTIKQVFAIGFIAVSSLLVSKLMPGLGGDDA